MALIFTGGPWSSSFGLGSGMHIVLMKQIGPLFHNLLYWDLLTGPVPLLGELFHIFRVLFHFLSVFLDTAVSSRRGNVYNIHWLSSLWKPTSKHRLPITPLIESGILVILLLGWPFLSILLYFTDHHQRRLVVVILIEYIKFKFFDLRQWETIV